MQSLKTLHQSLLLLFKDLQNRTHIKMAYIVEQQPSQVALTSTLQPVIFTVSDVSYSGFKYRFALKINDDTGAQLTTLALQPNNNDAASFNISQVLDSYIKTTEIQTPDDESSGSIHLLGITTAAKTCAIGGYTARKFLITLGFIKATTATGAVAFTSVSTGNKVFGLRWSGQTSDFADWDTTRLNNTLISGFSEGLTSFTSPLLSEIPQNGTGTWATGTNSNSAIYKDTVSMESYRTLATPTGISSGFDLDRPLNFWRIRVMNGSTEVGVFVYTINTAGGVSSTLVDADSMISFVGIGPMNLKTQTHNAGLATAINGTWTHYDIIASNTSAANPGTQLSGIYRYTKVDSPCLYNQFTIGFQNRSGTFDYIDVLGAQTNTTKVTSRSKYVGKSGNYLDTSTTVDWAAYGRNGGTTFRDVRSKRGMKVSTHWYDESRNVLMESLIVSRKVVMIDKDQNIIPIVITSSNYVEKTSLANKLFAYDITLEYAKERIS